MGQKKITTMVLEVDLQCERCYNKIKRLLCKYDQIRDQVYDEKHNAVRIIVVCCSPERIRDKLLRNGGKTIKRVEIVPDKTKPPEGKSPGGDKPPADSKKPPAGDKQPVSAATDAIKPPAGDKPAAGKAPSKEASPPKPAKGTDAAPAAAGAPKPSKEGAPPKGNDQAAHPKPKDVGGAKPEAAAAPAPAPVVAMPPAPDMVRMADPLTLMGGAVHGYPPPSYGQYQMMGVYGGAPQRYDAYYPTSYGPPPPPPSLAAPAIYGNPYSSYGSYPNPYPHPTPRQSDYNNYHYFTDENPSACSIM